jgi:acetylornithine deacetylase/succinyl-diaminopimelate desuccinylase-like protein
MSYYSENRERYLEELKAFLRIPSISTNAENKPDIAAAAAFTRDRLQEAGLENASLIEGEDNPLVYADWLHAEGKPTILFYGHYDVQPPDPLEEWKSDPFEPDVRGDNLYARGASDDKGQVYILIKAVEALLATTGKVPVNVRFLIEGEEEMGGEHIETFVASRDARLASDAVVICDTEMFAMNLPTICVGLRGILYGELAVEGADHDLHSGVYGGVAANPIQAIAEILTSLKDRDGRITIPGFCDKVTPPTAAEMDAWQALPFNEDDYKKNEVGVAELTGEPEYSTLERVWARPTMEVHGIRGGFTGDGAKTVIPARAVAKISTRLVADQDPAEAEAQLVEAIRKACPKGVSTAWTTIHRGAPSLVNTDNTYIQSAAKAMEEIFGNPTVYIRSGGSIPIVGVFDEHLGIPSVMMGFGLPDDNLHAPNEKFYLPNFYRGIEAVARYLEVLGAE